MPLDWKEIANRARAFSKDWKHVEREDADAKSFWDEFFEVFGIKRSNTMPLALLKAHRALDAAVDAAYALSGGKKSWKTDAERVAYLFTRYEALTSMSATA